jgi:hypothetical protein
LPMFVSLCLHTLLSSEQILLDDCFHRCSLLEPFLQITRCAMRICWDAKMSWGVTIEDLKGCLPCAECVVVLYQYSASAIQLTHLAGQACVVQWR